MQKLQLSGGVNRNRSETLNEGGWSRSDNIRFRQGLPEKEGGWAKLAATALDGIGRTLHAWEDIEGNTFLAAGSNELVYLWDGTTLHRLGQAGVGSNYGERRNVTNTNISATSGTPTITISSFSSFPGLAVGDWIEVRTPCSVGGLRLQGFFKLTAATDTSCSFSRGTNSTATGTAVVTVLNTTNTSETVSCTLVGHGYITGDVWQPGDQFTKNGIVFLRNGYTVTVVNADDFTIDTNDAADTTGTFSDDDDATKVRCYFYHIGSQSSSAGTPFRRWAVSNFGGALLASFTNNQMFKVTIPTTIDNGATEKIPPYVEIDVLAGSPSKQIDFLVASPQQQVFSLGAETGGTQDFLLVRWSDVGNETVWTAASTNQAGSYRLSRGSRIIGGLQGPGPVLIWTDVGAWTAQYIGGNLIYAFDEIAEGCGLIGPGARCILGSVVYWMSDKAFWAYNGASVQQIPCAVWDEVFKDLDGAKKDKSIAAANTQFQEVAFYFPSTSGGTGEPDRYARLNVQTGEWDYGEKGRTGWTDATIFGPPVGIDESGFLQQHENGLDADGAAMSAFVQSSYIDVGDGENYTFIERIIPDFVWAGSTAATPTVTLTVLGKDYPQETAAHTYGPFTVTSETKFVTLRARHRQIAVKIASSIAGVFWRLGALRYLGAPDGKI